MVFVRSKNIKGKKYAYLVENEWVNKKVKQKVKQYLGPIVLLPSITNKLSSLDFSFKKKLLQQLFSREFLARGASQEKDIFFFDSVSINLSSFEITRKNKPVVLQLSNSYLHSSLLKELCTFYQPETSDDVPGKKLAQLISKAGLTIDSSEFIELYSVLYLNKK